MKDSDGRRRLADRRRSSYRYHFPERQTLRFRRSGRDHRRNPGRTIATGRERRRALIESGPSVEAVA